MAIDNKPIVNGSNIEFGPVPASTRWAFTSIIVCNTGVSNATFSMYAVKSTEAQNDAENVIVYQAIVEPTDTFIMDSERIILEVGDKLVFRGNSVSSSFLIATVSYIEV
jgi:hypothetical protein